MTPEELLVCVQSGRSFFAQKKTASLYAVSHAYLVWKATAPAYAPQQARAWLREELKGANGGVAAYNTALKNDRKRGLAALRGKLTEEDLARGGADNSAGELARLRELAVLDDDAFSARLQVQVKFNEDDTEISFNAVVRFVFELYQRVDAPLVSRYACVLGWIDAEYGRDLNLDAQKIADGIQAADGFEAVLHARREQSGTAKKSSTKKGDGKFGTKAESQKANKVTAPNTETFSAETVTVTLRVPSWWDGIPKVPFSLHCVPIGPEEFRVFGYDYLDDYELSELQAFFDDDVPTTETGATASPKSAEEPALEDASAPPIDGSVDENAADQDTLN